MNRTFETSRLIIRPLDIEDVDDMYELYSDPEVNKYLTYPLYTSKEDAEQWILGLQPEQNEFVFVLKENGKVIGGGSPVWNEAEHAYELGYQLNSKYWGKGYATEAAKALMNWAKQEFHLTEMIIKHVKENHASENVISKLGYQYEKDVTFKKPGTNQVFHCRFYRIKF